MSTWNLGINDVSKEAQVLNDRLSSKDSLIAAQQTELIKQTADMEELRVALNEALYKLSNETGRVLHLETAVKRYEGDLKQEKTSSQNLSSALLAAQDKLRSKDLEVRQLDAHLQSISYSSDEHMARSEKLAKEKAMLEARVKELQACQPTLNYPPITPGRTTKQRPRSSSLSDLKIAGLEAELREARNTASEKDGIARTLSSRLSDLQNEVTRVSNEKLAMERRLKMQLEASRAALEEREDEVEFLRAESGDHGREEELLRRIEEDEAKIEALERLCRGSEDSRQLQQRLDTMASKLQTETARVTESQERNVELVQEKEEALSELESVEAELKKYKELLRTSDNNRNLASNETNAAAQQLVSRLRGERDALRRDLEFLDIESKFAIESLESRLASQCVTKERVTHLNKVIQVFAITLGHVQSCNDAAAQQLCHMSDEAKSLRAAHDEATSSLQDLQLKYDVTVSCLQEVTRDRDDLALSRQQEDLAHRAESDRTANTGQESIARITFLEGQINDLHKELENVESERDSLTLQVRNQLTELKGAQQELESAETRYSTLQFHQLASMSSSQANAALRDQIHELEMRVARRTEQIGIHQHDIKRLETNLRLQEERLGEITGEFETLAAEKAAMVEDCADAREARDEALAEVERLEEDVENLDIKLYQTETTVTVLIGIIICNTGRSRLALQQSREQLRQITETAVVARPAEQDFMDSTQTLRDSVLALATLWKAKQQALLLAQALREQKSRFQTEARDLQQKLDASQSNGVELENQLRLAHSSSSSLERKCQDEIIVLQDRIHSLQTSIDEKERFHVASIQELETFKLKLASTIAEGSDASSPEDIERTLTSLKTRHANKIGELQGRLSGVSSDLEKTNRRYQALELTHTEAIVEATLSQKTLSDQLAEANNLISHIRSEHETAQKSTREEISKLQQELDTTTERGAADLEALRDQLTDELKRAHQEHETIISQLNATAQAKDDQLAMQVAALQATLKESSAQIESLNVELEDLTKSLSEQEDAHSQALSAKEQDLRQMTMRCDHAEETLKRLEIDLRESRTALLHAKTESEATAAEKLSLQEEITALEAEIQRSISLGRYLESQFKDSEIRVTTLNKEVDSLKSTLAHAEKTAKAAETNLSLQGAQHRREMGDLQRELSGLRSKPSLESALAELEERNNEMEELLRTKCAEIEQNDDRALEMLKENKKLSTKVESLNRKVQNLQAKLTAAKASQQATPPPLPELTRAKDMDLTVPSPAPRFQPPVPALERTKPLTGSHVLSPPSSSSTPITRVVSAPSSIPRPKTPERKAVFKLKTPEQSRVPTSRPELLSASSLSAGKKRRAPDDFEASEALPPQAFNADSLPMGDEVELSTPRARRIINSIQSGFTPLRGQRPTIPLPSPRRASEMAKTSHLIADVTNSPRGVSLGVPGSSSKPQKRSWLGKIRGVSTAQVSSRPTSSRPWVEPSQ